MSADTLFSLIVGVPVSGTIFLYFLLQPDREKKTKARPSPPEDTLSGGETEAESTPDQERAA